MPEIIPNNIEKPISESHNSLNSDSEICHSISKKEHELRQKCRKNCKASVARIRNILLSLEYIMKENRHLNLNLIFITGKYVSIYIRSFKRSIYVIRFFFANKHCSLDVKHKSINQTFSLQLQSET